MIPYMPTPTLAMVSPHLALYEDFLTDVECALLIWLAQDKMQKSRVMDNTSGTHTVSQGRTSSGMYFKLGENELVEHIEKKISMATGYPVENGEGLQVLRYDVGQEYKPHFDYFNPKGVGIEKHLANNRVCTVLMYLNTPDDGGETTFPDAKLVVLPKQGNAVRFTYDTPTPDTLTLHGGAPVRQGVKWVATKWIRQGAYK